MKKVIALLLSAVLLLGLTACAGTKDQSSAKPEVENVASDSGAQNPNEASTRPYEGVKLSFWWPPFGRNEEMSYWTERFAGFEEETGAEVSITVVPWEDMSTKYMAGFMSDEGPDVFYMTNEITYDMAEAGALLNLTPHFTEEEIANQLFWKTGYTVGNEVYSLPVFGGVDYRGMHFNMDILKSAGITDVPTTWDEVIDATLKIKEAGVCEYPILFPINDSNSAVMCTYIPMLYSAGGSILNENGDAPALDSQAALDAAQFLYDLSNKYEVLSKNAVTLGEENVVELFVEGKVAMATLPPALVLGVDKDFEYYSNAGVSKAGCDVVTFSGYDALSVNANSKNLDAAIALLKYIVSTEGREDFRANYEPSVGAMNADMQPTVYDEECVTETVATIAEHGRPLPVCKGLPSIIEAIKTNEQLLVMGDITPEEACKAMQTSAVLAVED